MNSRWMVAVAVIGLFTVVQSVRADSSQRLGLGANYWTMVDNVKLRDIDENGFSYLATYQYQPARFLKLELDAEVFPEHFQGIDGWSCAPEAYIVAGSTLYLAGGIGILYAHDDFADKPFYALRAGLDLEIVPRFFLDLNVNYRFSEMTNLSAIANDINGDTMMFGAALRLSL